MDIQEQGSNLYIVEQPGRIITFNTESPQSQNVFLDIISRVDSGGSEEGLLGLAFHPNFNSNNRFFVYYCNKNSETVLSEFTATSSTQADESSERELLAISQPFSNHNGGQIQFGPDGFLYVAGLFSIVTIERLYSL